MGGAKLALIYLLGVVIIGKLYQVLDRIYRLFDKVDRVETACAQLVGHLVKIVECLVHFDVIKRYTRNFTLFQILRRRRRRFYQSWFDYRLLFSHLQGNPLARI